VKLGHSSKWEVSLCRHPDTREVCLEEEGGEWAEEKPNTSIKYPGEARVCAGALMFKATGTEADGVHEGHKGKTLTLFNYTGRTVVGLKAWKKARLTEMARVKPLEGCWKKPGDGYPERYGLNWEAVLDAYLRKKICPVTDLMDHVIDTSAAAYAGTAHADDFMIFHDGLSSWWEAGAQAHMRSRGFEHRQIRNINANKGTRYEGKIVGDSPEMCRALDSHGFADLEAAILAYSSFTSVYAVDDPRRFKLGTPDEVFRSIERAWDVAPTSKRIVEDILALPRVLSKIIEYEGCVVPDEVLRHGRRAAKWECSEMSTSDQKAKPRSFTRIETLASSVPAHPDVDPARAMLRSGSRGN
jgi:hypothetical protein